MSTYVHRDGARQITVHDEAGRELTFTSQHHALYCTTTDEGPRLTPQMARDLGDVLHQWADSQQTVRSQRSAQP